MPTPYPSPTDWRDCWIYFFLTDRFNNPNAKPIFQWDQKYSYWQGGKFEGVRLQLGYLQTLGVNAIWISPVVKNPKPASFAYTYPGYDAQDFLNIDGRFATDGTQATAEKELTALVQEAHARGIYVILDIVLNHAGQVFNYVYNGSPSADFTDANVMNGSPGSEPPIQWLDGSGAARSDWQNTLPARRRCRRMTRSGRWICSARISFADAATGFRTNSTAVRSSAATSTRCGKWCMSTMRPRRARGAAAQYGPMPVLSILILAYQYMVARFDFDGFRIDTIKYMRPDIVETFCNAMREFALEIGKQNFFTFGEIYDNETDIDQFVGRNSGDVDGFGMDAALDFPLFYNLASVVKGYTAVETIQTVFENRKAAERGTISSHGEAGKYFVSFLDNHDQNQRFNVARNSCVADLHGIGGAVFPAGYSVRLLRNRTRIGGRQ